MNLNSVMIGSEDAKRLADYYTKLFGEPDWSDQGFAGWQLGQGSLTVGPHDEVSGATPSPAGSCATWRRPTCRANSSG